MIRWILLGLTLFLVAVWIPTYLDERKKDRRDR
jgi:hypothetical protein